MNVCRRHLSSFVPLFYVMGVCVFGEYGFSTNTMAAESRTLGRYEPKLAEPRPEKYPLAAYACLLPERGMVVFRIVNRSVTPFTLDRKTIVCPIPNPDIKIANYKGPFNLGGDLVFEAWKHNLLWDSGKFRGTVTPVRKQGEWGKYSESDYDIGNNTLSSMGGYSGQWPPSRIPPPQYVPRLPLSHPIYLLPGYYVGTQVQVPSKDISFWGRLLELVMTCDSRKECWAFAGRTWIFQSNSDIAKDPIKTDIYLFSKEVAISPEIASRYRTAMGKKVAPQSPVTPAGSFFTSSLNAELHENRLFVDVLCGKDEAALHMKTLDVRNWTWAVTVNGKSVTGIKFAEPATSTDGGKPTEPAWPSVEEYDKMPSPAFLYGQLAGRVIKVSDAPFFSALREFRAAAPNSGKATATLAVEIPLFLPDKDNKPVASGVLKAELPISRDDIGTCLGTVSYTHLTLPTNREV